MSYKKYLYHFSFRAEEFLQVLLEFILTVVQRQVCFMNIILSRY